MKLPILIAIVVVVSIGVALLQQGEINRLQQRGADLDRKLADLDHDPEPAAEETELVHAVGSTARSKSAPVEEEDASQSKAQKSAAEFLRLCEELMATSSQTEATVRLLPKLAVASPEMLKEILLQLEGSTLDKESQMMAWHIIIGKLIKREPVESMRMILEDSGQPQRLFSDAFQSWIERDPAAAEDWYRSAVADGGFPLEPASLTADAETRLFGLVAERDLDEAFRMIAAAGGEDAESQREVMLKGIEQTIISSHRWERLADAALGAEDPGLRDSVIELLAKRAFDHGSVAQQLERIDGLGLEGEDLYAFALKAVHVAPFRRTPRPIANWGLERLPEDMVRQEVPQLVDKWSQIWQQGVHEWAEELPEGLVRDLVQERLAAP